MDLEAKPSAVFPIERQQLTKNMIVLCLIAAAEGMDAALWPSVTNVLTKKHGFDIDDIAMLGTVQLIFQAVAGPVWGWMASQRKMSRENILIIGCFGQGLATGVMWMSLDLVWLLSIRGVNGIFLAALRPIANSIVGDMFDEENRGKNFGFIMFALQSGTATCSVFATGISDMFVFGGPDNPSKADYQSSFIGWELAFIVIGVLTAVLAPLVYILLKPPPVAVPEPGTQVNLMQDFKKIFRRKSFLLLVFQGMFGLVPWRAMDFRVFFFQNSGVNDLQSGILSAAGGYCAAIGNLLGGLIGDFFQKVLGDHGRPLTAELSVWGGIPVGFFIFIVSAPDDGAFWYYLVLICALGLIAGWTPAGANNPILCALADEKERALILSLQTSLEGSVGALGVIAFPWVLTNVFDLPKNCISDHLNDQGVKVVPAECIEVDDKIGVKAGQALFWICFIPWGICGSFYAALHFTYPRDLRDIESERADGLLGMRTEMSAPALES